MKHFGMEITKYLLNLLVSEFEHEADLLAGTFYDDDEEVSCEKLEEWIVNTLKLTEVNEWLKDEILEQVELSCLMREVEYMMKVEEDMLSNNK